MDDIKVVSWRLGCIWSDYWAGKHHTDLATLLSGKKTKHHLTFERDGAMTERNQRTRGRFRQPSLSTLLIEGSKKDKD